MCKTLLFFVPFLTLVVVGCGGEPADGDASGGALITLHQAAMPVDRVPDNFTFYAVRPDTRKCIAPICGGWFVRRVNRATTACADGTNNAECYVATIDWERLGLDAATHAALIDAAHGGTVMVRGTLVARTFGHYGNLGQLNATEGWRAPSGNEPTGALFRVHDTGIECYAAPCLSVRAEVLNWYDAGVNLSDVNFDRTCATAREVAVVRAAMTAGWVLMAGAVRPTNDAIGLDFGMELIVTQFFTRVVPAPAPPDDTCGGIAGKVCADGMICDVTVENACYGADLPGMCKPAPQACVMVYDPVCGCDGKTYSNDCVRLAARAQLAHRGACVH